MLARPPVDPGKRNIAFKRPIPPSSASHSQLPAGQDARRARHVDDIEAAVAAAAPHGVRPIAPPVTIDQGPNRGGKVAYLRDWDGVTIEFIELPNG